MTSLISVYTIHCIYSSCLFLCIVSTFMPRSSGEKCYGKLSVYMIHPPIVHVGIMFQPSRPHSSWEKCDKNILMFENWTKRKMKNKGTIMQQPPDSSIHNTATHCPHMHQVSTKFLGLTVPEKSVTKLFNVWILEKEKTKGRISNSSLILVYTIHPSTVHVCTEFQPSRPHSSL